MCERQCVCAQRAVRALREHEQDPINLAIDDDAPRSTADLVAFWVRTFDRWTSDAEQNARVGPRVTVQQYAGRLHRVHERKREVRIYDYVDNAVSMLAKMPQRRLRGYSAIGYSVADRS